MSMQTKNNTPQNFLEAYEAEIAPKLRTIDLFLKTHEGDIALQDASHVLDLPETEIKNIMKESHIQTIDKHAFFLIMRRGSSRVCNLFKREIACGSPYFYSKKDIAYIYGIDIAQITKACDFLEIEEITAYSLPLLFAQVPVGESV